MKTQATKYFVLLFAVLFVGLTGCTKYAIKNRALVLAVEKYDSEVQDTAKAQFVDKEQQKVFVDFAKLNTKLDVESIDIKSDTEATAQLKITTFPKTLVPELAGISGKDWKSKVDAAMETKSYTLKLQKADGSWKLIEQTENK
ncbi:hypothetical protein [Bdellovibrio sp. HCB337]|uniref:hypothetical protein n=1 Tax=Bdellovibrio sp. HCB337 TaxID=3394358 RepID=UPI0039A50478